MRLQYSNDDVENKNLAEFANWILDIGDGKVGKSHDGESTVEIPSDLLVHCLDKNPIGDIVEVVYPNLLSNMFVPGFFEDKAILAPTLEVVDKINDYVLSLIPGEFKEYLSCDTISKCENDIGVDHRWITTEFLNKIRCCNIPKF
jgi:ATP-dependent DNA helicase PIF1